MARAKGTKSRPFPPRSLEQSLLIVETIVDQGASRPMDRLLVAAAIGRTPSSSEFKRLLSTSRAYGLTQGTEKADKIVPTDLGLKITKALSPDEKASALVEACLTPELMGKVLRHFNKNKFPETKFLKNYLERSEDIDPERSDELASLLIENAKFCGILQDISGANYIRIEDPSPATDIEGTNDSDASDSNELKEVIVGGEIINDNNTSDVNFRKQEEPRSEGPKQLFIAHGKNSKPLEDLKKILDQFKIPYKVAVDEPHAGRPISAKVAGLMRECSAGVFVFTRDELFFQEDESGNRKDVWRPSENVVYELGAANVLWDKKIIILREDGVNFPSDFSDLGYITFTEEEISAKALDLLKELVGLGLVKVQAA